MTEIILSASTGSVTIDDMLRGVVGIFEMVFAKRIRSYYVEGSYADGTAVTASDLDLTVVFKDRFRDDIERDTAVQLAGYCAGLSGVELDIELADDGQLAEGVYPSLKMGSRCMYGEDRRDQLRLLSLDEWTRERMHAAYWLLVTVFHRPRPVTYPLTYPDPVGRFYGYDHRMMRLATGAAVNSTRDLIRVTGWIATALLAYRAGDHNISGAEFDVPCRSFLNASEDRTRRHVQNLDSDAFTSASRGRACYDGGAGMPSSPLLAAHSHAPEYGEGPADEFRTTVALPGVA